MFYSKEEQAMLEGSPMIQHIKEELLEIAEEYNKICNEVPEMAKFSCFEYQKMKTLVISRVFYTEVNGVADRIMVPLCDMFNFHYELGDQTYWEYFPDTKEFKVKSQRRIPRGETIS